MPDPSKDAYSPMQAAGRRLLRKLLIALAVLTVLHLLLTASLASLIGGIVILVMVWGIHTGDYGLRKALVVFLVLYGVTNLIVLGISAFFSSSARALSLLWLGLYSLGLLLCAYLLCRPSIHAWLEVAPQPQAKEKKIHFFHGGWRDL